MTLTRETSPTPRTLPLGPIVLLAVLVAPRLLANDGDARTSTPRTRPTFSRVLRACLHEPANETILSRGRSLPIVFVWL